MGESEQGLDLTTIAHGDVPLALQTSGGKIRVSWDENAAATPFGQMAFFIEFLTETKLFDDWVGECPLEYVSPNAPSVRDVLGTWLLSVMSGHFRYAHVSALRSEGVNAGLLGMNRVVSEDSLRRALSAIPEEQGLSWLNRHLLRTALPLLGTPWILDIDVTVKPLYGRQEGAVLGYNPQKPGRPSHAYHTYQVSMLRLLLGVDVQPGNEAAAQYGRPSLLELLEHLPKEKRPALVRGDAGQSSESLMSELEKRSQPYLFKLRQTANVKRHIESVFWENEWEYAGHGYHGKDGTLKLSGWSSPRRVIVLRRPLRDTVVASHDEQATLAFENPDKNIRFEYVVLVTNLAHEIMTVAQLYRDRGDCENTFDELKNQWGWGGFTTQDLHRCRLSALAVALCYNWWSLFVRLGIPKAKREAITSRPLLLSAVARRTSHAGGQQLTITSQHSQAALAKKILTKIHALLLHFKQIAEQLNTKDVWSIVCKHIATTIAHFTPPNPLLLPVASRPNAPVNCGF